MTTQTSYEWNRERLEHYKAHESVHGEDGFDIIDSEYNDKLNTLPTHNEVMKLWSDTDDTALCLMRNVHEDDGDLKDRQYAYVKDGELGEFDGGAKVPVKYRREFERSGLTK